MKAGLTPQLAGVVRVMKSGRRPEFRNRIEETILFKPRTLEEITTIVDLLLADLNRAN